MHTQTTSTQNAHSTKPLRRTGARLCSAGGVGLPLQSSSLSVEALGGLARTILQQTFVNAHHQPLTVTYSLPLPADGVVSGFSFVVAGRKVVGEVDTKKRARDRFAQAIAAGRTAAMLEQDRVNQFTQKVGNIPVGAEVVCEILVDQPLKWRDEGAWEWRFPTVVGERYMGAVGRVDDAEKIGTPRVIGEIRRPGCSLALLIRDGLLAGKGPSSPSHALDVQQVGSMCRVTFGADEVRLDRDIVVRWPTVAPDVGLRLHVARPADSRHHESDAFGLLTIVPPEAEQGMKSLPRDLIVLIDTSGSMGGWPLLRARQLVSAMIETLDDNDRLELIEFSSRPNRWRNEPVLATRAGKKAAIQWVEGLQAGGCTEMHDAILEAMRPLRGNAQRQIVLVTDGYIGFENEILAEVHQRLPRGTRLHTIGVGSSVNRALTEPVARAGAGVEILLDPNDDVMPAVQQLLARTTAPLVTELSVRGSAIQGTVPAKLPDLFAGAPVLLSTRLRPEGGTLEVEGLTADGAFSHTIEVLPSTMGEGNQAITALFGRESIGDLEVWRASIDLSHARSRETLSEIEATMEEIGLRYQIATRFTSWIAVDSETSVEPQSQQIEEVMPHEFPHGTSISSLGLRPSLPLAVPSFGQLISEEQAKQMPHSLGNLYGRYNGISDFDDDLGYDGFEGGYDGDDELFGMSPRSLVLPEPTVEAPDVLFDEFLDAEQAPEPSPMMAVPSAPQSFSALYEQEAESYGDLSDDSMTVMSDAVSGSSFGPQKSKGAKPIGELSGAMRIGASGSSAWVVWLFLIVFFAALGFLAYWFLAL